MAFQAVPNPGVTADTFLVPHHPVAKELYAHQYEQDRDRFRQQHKVLFRYVIREFRFIERWYENERVIYPSNVKFLDLYWKRCFGSETAHG